MSLKPNSALIKTLHTETVEHAIERYIKLMLFSEKISDSLEKLLQNTVKLFAQNKPSCSACGGFPYNTRRNFECLRNFNFAAVED